MFLDEIYNSSNSDSLAWNNDSSSLYPPLEKNWLLGGIVWSVLMYLDFNFELIKILFGAIKRINRIIK